MKNLLSHHARSVFAVMLFLQAAAFIILYSLNLFNADSLPSQQKLAYYFLIGVYAISNVIVLLCMYLYYKYAHKPSEPPANDDEIFH